MGTTIELGPIPVDVVLKDIKNIHLTVHPPTGRVRISAPARMPVDRIRLFAISKLDWIKEQQRKLREQERETPREYLCRESHYVWGRRYLLTVIEHEAPPAIEITHNRLVLRVRPASSSAKRESVIENWYRAQVKEATAELITRWERLVGVRVAGFYIQRMRTRWGSCNSAARTIRLNTDLARKPRECLEYIVVHEMIHILEPTHNERFQAHMTRLMPDWKHRRQVLNRLPVRHENWDY
ncbi:MAG TPA: SprT family zinc-dependent metalloprotease [Pirellulales bacterium]|nr:SprT family zinc-dependent metalloprotease [Pirellulales bacterium]